MPGPDPEGLTVTHDEPGRVSVMAHTWPWCPVFGGGNVRNRVARAKAVLRNLVANRWRCEWCQGPVPVWRRADARFCCEGCRKRAARAHRRARH